MTTNSLAEEGQNNAGRVDKDEITAQSFITLIGGIFSYLASRKKIIVLFGIIGCLVGLTYAHFKTPIYTASSTFVLEDGESGGGLGQYAGLASIAGIDLGGGGGIFQGDNIIELYKSRTMVQKTLLSEITYAGKRKLLIERFIEINNLRKAWKEHKVLANISFNSMGAKPMTRLQDSILGEVVKEINKRYLEVSKPDKKLNIIKVEVKSGDESFSIGFNNNIVRNVNEFYVQTKTKRSLANVKVLQQKTDSVRAVMNGAIFAAAAVTDATPNLNLTRQISRVAPVQRSQFNAETNKSILVELVKNLEMSKIALRKETPLIQIVDSPILPLDKSPRGYVKFSIIFGFLAMFIALLYLAFRKVWASTIN